MTSMSVGASTPFTVHDLEGMPHDGRRYELIDGDLNLKRAAYERMGTPSYWVLDPEVPELLVLELVADGHYQEVARAVGDEVYEAHQPFTVRIVPIELLGRLHPRDLPGRRGACAPSHR